MTSKRVCTPCDVTRGYFGTSPWKTKRSFLGYFGPRKNVFSPEMLLRLENYESVDHRLRFPGIKMRSKISFHGTSSTKCVTYYWNYETTLKLYGRANTSK